MANTSDDQRKAMFANMRNPRSKRKSKRLKRPKYSGLLTQIKAKQSEAVESKNKIVEIPKSELPSGWVVVKATPSNVIYKKGVGDKRREVILTKSDTPGKYHVNFNLFYYEPGGDLNWYMADALYDLSSEDTNKIAKSFMRLSHVRDLPHVRTKLSNLRNIKGI